jgi:hypothetical protein
LFAAADADRALAALAERGVPAWVAGRAHRGDGVGRTSLAGDYAN